MPPKEIVCLCYHAISASWPSRLAVSPARLEAQLRYLLARGWRPATFTEAVLRPKANRTLVVTFDDAFASVIELAFPILSTLGVPATVFAPTGFMDARQPLLWPGVDHWAKTTHAHELTSMDWNDLRALAAQGWEVGSHTCTHPRLDQTPDPKLASELVRSREACEQHLQRPCTSLAYPYGATNQTVADRASEAGYLAAAILGPAACALGPHCYPRIGVYHADSTVRFRAKVAARRVQGSALWQMAQGLWRR